MRWTLDTSFAAALAAIILGTLAGVLSVVFPGAPWVAPVVAGLAALGALLRRTAGLPDDGAD